MKKLLLILIFVSFSLSYSFSQKIYSEYSSKYFSRKYDLEVSFNKDDETKYNIWINATSNDDLVSKVGIKVKSEIIDTLINSLVKIKDKYVEWSNIAKEKNVTELYKDFPINIPAVDGFFYYYDDWEFDYSIIPTAHFIIMKSKNEELYYLLLIELGELKSSSNEFIKCKGLYIGLSSIKEIDDFITKISPETILKFKTIPKTEDLFK